MLLCKTSPFSTTVAIILVFIISALDSFELYTQTIPPDSPDISRWIKYRTLAAAASYILRPFIILIQVLITLPSHKYKLYCIVPAVFNALLYSTAILGLDITFYIDNDNHWKAGIYAHTVYFVQMIYIILLLIFSIMFFHKKNISKSSIVFAIFIQSVLISIFEYKGILVGYVNAVTALCLIEYYFYLSLIYQQEIKDIAVQNELNAIKSELSALRNQMQPHFIYNTLNVIRSLAKRDNHATVMSIDIFSKYLRSHIEAISQRDLIPFTQELENVRVFLQLVQIDYSNTVDVNYDINESDFHLPPLSLEPIIENAVFHGIGGTNGRIDIRSYSDDTNIIISISDNGTAKCSEGKYTLVHNGIGIDNTKKRLKLLCNGSLTMDITDAGATVSVTIPKEKGENHEDISCR